MTIDYKRQTKLFNPTDHAERHVTIVGLGNIGSHTALALVRMGVQHFTLYDFDEVETHNLSSQAYSVEDVGKLKGDALVAEMRRFNPDVDVTFHSTAFQEGGRIEDIGVIAVDSMATREELCTMLEAQDVQPFVIDGRMGGGQVEVYAQGAGAWRDTLRADADTDECSARYISYTSYVIAGAIANTLKRYLQGQRTASRFVMHVDTWDIITQWNTYAPQS